MPLKFTIGLILVNIYPNVGSLPSLPLKLQPDSTLILLPLKQYRQINLLCFEFPFKMSSIKFNRLLIDDFVKSLKTKESRMTDYCFVLFIKNEIIDSSTKIGSK